ncbi:MAG: hypothetical protein ACPIOQ_18640, partial [Promethearchaeia archaeon]
MTRGPGFKITSAAFAPLCPDRPDYPSTAQVVAAVRSELSQAPQKHDSVVFAGFGEPTLRLPDLLEMTRVSDSLPARPTPPLPDRQVLAANQSRRGTRPAASPEHKRPRQLDVGSGYHGGPGGR